MKVSKPLSASDEAAIRSTLQVDINDGVTQSTRTRDRQQLLDEIERLRTVLVDASAMIAMVIEQPSKSSDELWIRLADETVLRCLERRR